MHESRHTLWPRMESLHQGITAHGSVKKGSDLPSSATLQPVHCQKVTVFQRASRNVSKWLVRTHPHGMRHLMKAQGLPEQRFARQTFLCCVYTLGGCQLSMKQVSATNILGLSSNLAAPIECDHCSTQCPGHPLNQL
eukprot:4832424-Amphidinium_carterae.2